VKVAQVPQAPKAVKRRLARDSHEAGAPTGSDQPLDPYDGPSQKPPSSEDAQAEGYLKMGRLFLAQRDYPKAVAAFNRAREHDSRNASAIFGIGQVAYNQGKYAEAAIHFQAATRLAPKHANYRVWLGHALLGSGRTREAAVEYRIALRYDPTSETARQGLARAQQ
jgi:tetratricopeptide (TPR) repeat protein